jgi:hypothetical protein
MLIEGVTPAVSGCKRNEALLPPPAWPLQVPQLATPLVASCSAGRLDHMLPQSGHCVTPAFSTQSAAGGHNDSVRLFCRHTRGFSRAPFLPALLSPFVSVSEWCWEAITEPHLCGLLWHDRDSGEGSTAAADSAATLQALQILTMGATSATWSSRQSADLCASGAAAQTSCRGSGRATLVDRELLAQTYKINGLITGARAQSASAGNEPDC